MIVRWIFGAFIGVSLLVALVIWMSLNTNELVKRNSEKLVQQGLPALEKISDLRSALSNLINQLYLFYATTDHQAFYRAQSSLSMQIQKDLNLIRKHGVTEEESHYIEQRINLLDTVNQEFSLEMAGNGRDWDKLRSLLANAQSLADSMTLKLTEWQVSIRNQARNDGKIALQEVSHLSVILVVFSIGISTVAAFVLLSLYGRLKDRDALFRLAYQDELTGLPNRKQLERTLESEIQEGHAGSLFLLRIARYNLLTSTYGYVTGRLLILHVSQWLEQKLAYVPHEVSLYRYSDDSWMLHCHKTYGKQALCDLADGLMELSQLPISAEKRPFNVECTMGVIRYPRDGAMVDSLLRNAQAALQDAADSPEGYCFFDSSMTRYREQWLAIDAALRQAIKHKQFELYYQVKVDAQSEEPIGAEALIRWWRDGQMVPPGDFIGIAERSGLIVPIGNWVMDQACRQLKSWRDQNLNLVPIAVNISAQQFQQEDFPQRVSDLLGQYELSPELLELEITEEVAAGHPEKVEETMNRLKGIGVKIALDDFGTGYSSLSYLQRFPIDTLKIDRSFIRYMGSRTTNDAIIDLLLSLAKQMNFKVVAEGVETKEQQAMLQAQGCDYLQGFLFDKPLPVSEFEKYIRQPELKASTLRLVSQNSI